MIESLICLDALLKFNRASHTFSTFEKLKFAVVTNNPASVYVQWAKTARHCPISLEGYNQENALSGKKKKNSFSGVVFVQLIRITIKFHLKMFFLSMFTI